MDSFSFSEQVLDKVKYPLHLERMLRDQEVLITYSLFSQDSPSNKLLYAREITGYRQEVERSVNNLVC